MLRAWRRRRGASQLALAVQSGVSQRHVSFLESGRARPSREMVVQLSSALGSLEQRDRAIGISAMDHRSGQPCLSSRIVIGELICAREKGERSLGVAHGQRSRSRADERLNITRIARQKRQCRS